MPQSITNFIQITWLFHCEQFTYAQTLNCFNVFFVKMIRIRSYITVLSVLYFLWMIVGELIPNTWTFSIGIPTTFNLICSRCYTKEKIIRKFSISNDIWWICSFTFNTENEIKRNFLNCPLIHPYEIIVLHHKCEKKNHKNTSCRINSNNNKKTFWHVL